MPRSMNPKRKSVLIVIALLVVAVVVWIAARDYGDANSPADGTVNTEPGPTGGAGVADTPAPNPGESPSQGESPDPAEEAESPDDPVDRFAGLRDNEIPRDVELRFTESGEPLPHLDFSYQVLGGMQVADMRRGRATLAMQDAATDSSGVWTTRAPYWATVVVRLDGRVFAQDYRRWRHSGMPQTADYAYIMVGRNLKLGDEYVAELRSGEKVMPPRKLDLAVTRVENLFVEIVYADGQPYEGEVKWQSKAGGRNSHRGVESAEAGRLTLPAPVSSVLQISTPPVQRDGYRRHNGYEFTPNELASGVLYLTIPADPDRPLMRGIEVDHTALEPGEEAYITLFNVISKSVNNNWVKVSGPGVYRSEDLNSAAHLICMVTSRSIHDAPTPGRQATGNSDDGHTGDDEPGFAWSSNVFQLEPGEWRRLTFERKTAAGLTVRAVDPKGDPIAHAALRHTSHHPTGFFDRRPPVDGLFARIEGEQADGRLTLNSIPPGDHEFTVEGRGYEPHHFSVTLGPGQSLDLGDITLQPSTSVVRVVLKGAEIPADRYQAFLLLNASLATWLQPFPGDGKPLEFRSVTSGGGYEYYVFAQRVEGGGGWHSRRFSIAPGEEVTVEVDVSQPFAGTEGGNVNGSTSSMDED